MIIVGEPVRVDLNLPEGYEKQADFFMSLMNEESFYGFDNSSGGMGYLDEQGRNIPLESTKPTPEKVQLEACIKAASRLYWQFMDEYKEKYGVEFNG